MAIALVSTVFWFFGGPNLGWTKTSVTRIELDKVTEIEFPVTEKRFIPGVDFMAAGWLAAAGLAVASCFFRAPGADSRKERNDHGRKE